MSKSSVYAALAGVAILLTAALPAAAQNIDAKEYRLDNGMQVLMVERHEAPTIMAAIFCRVGSANETTGITGISHLFEHMMFKGTETIGTTDAKKNFEVMAQLDSHLRADHFPSNIGALHGDGRAFPRKKCPVLRYPI